MSATAIETKVAGGLISFDEGTREILIRVPADPARCAAAPLSNSRKSRLVANSGGFKPIEGTGGKLKINLNVIYTG